MMDVVGVLAAMVVLGVLVYNLVSNFANRGRLNTVLHGLNLIVGLLLLASYFGFTQAVPVDVELLMLVLALLLVPLLISEYLFGRAPRDVSKQT
ncbi:hypothetical protein E6P09_03795 [Haloferax mediterranei ATCC 33500]|uniref:Uncharacterized protein n=1 Tax=Haloferax mediterranei (strain ATCC 33500 / DSM 1411 / JCM 8866 / NBRC 14739 / NCIMB 2177 / R-4) TaxID=523841 RepID=M0J530_HALMT|nr:hypothetical protein [Haloferax mediterranei]AHZ22696.1 hypothetical protein BM92_08570 [Haloferax mediterranei ATCC 33500]EMA02845.1 hypothetical protein C439_09690 [Haloferax mediterranei ATCC 33500]MDX5987971.1 hypothetical protein [Haloferax mediterranei ATCC 33500]QCQ74440.1 hypothetical protein E6P09_03795 [Haloferax mediterranei ATCC 33500]